MMTGNVLRPRVSFELVQKGLERAVELLHSAPPHHRTHNQCRDLIKVVKGMEFFKQNLIPFTDEDAIGIIKRLQYRYVPKGKAVRKALDETDRLTYIICGKVVCALPTEEESKRRAKRLGIDLTGPGAGYIMNAADKR